MKLCISYDLLNCGNLIAWKGNGGTAFSVHQTSYFHLLTIKYMFRSIELKLHIRCVWLDFKLTSRRSGLMYLYVLDKISECLQLDTVDRDVMRLRVLMSNVTWERALKNARNWSCRRFFFLWESHSYNHRFGITSLTLTMELEQLLCGWTQE